MSDALAQAFSAESQRRALDLQSVRESITTGVGGALGVWRQIRDFGYFNLTGLAQGTYLLVPGAQGLAVPAATDGSAASMFYLQPTYHAASGYGTRARLRTQTSVNATAPLSTFAVSVVLAGALSGANSPRVAIGSAPSPAMSVTAATAPAAQNKNPTGTSEIDISAWSGTNYVLQLVVSGADMAAGSHVMLAAQLEVRNV